MKIPVSECPAGGAMDTAVEKVYGPLWHPSVEMQSADYLIDAGLETSNCPEGFQLSNGNIGEEYFRANESVYGWTACFDTGYNTEIFASAETRPLAICRAFLKLHGITEIEVGGD